MFRTVALLASAVVLALPARATAQDPVFLTLGEAARLAAEQSTPALAAQLRTREAEARLAQKKGELYPTLRTSVLESGHTVNSATFGFDFPAPEGEKPLLDPNGQIIGPVNTLDIRAHVIVPAVDFAARERIAGARKSVRASEAAARSAAEQAAANAGIAWIRAARAEALLRARAADSALADSLLVIADAQLKAGVGVVLDVTRAHSQVARIHSEIIAARGEQMRSRLELARAVGSSPDIQLRVEGSLADAAAAGSVPDEAQAIAAALKQRADIVAADRAIEAAEQASRAIRAERLPTLSAFADDGAIGITPRTMLHTYMWGVQLSIPVWDGPRRSGRLSEQQAIASGLELQRRQLIRDVSTEVRAALLDLGIARDQVQAATGRLNLAEQEYAQSVERFRAGVAGNSDVISASLALNAARDVVIDAEAAYQSARVSFARAQGTATQLQ